MYWNRLVELQEDIVDGVLKLSCAPNVVPIECKLRDKAEKFVVLTQLHRQSAYTWGQKEMDFRGFPMDQFS